MLILIVFHVVESFVYLTISLLFMDNLTLCRVDTWWVVRHVISECVIGVINGSFCSTFLRLARRCIEHLLVPCAKFWIALLSRGVLLFSVSTGIRYDFLFLKSLKSFWLIFLVSNCCFQRVEVLRQNWMVAGRLVVIWTFTTLLLRSEIRYFLRL